MKCPKCNAPMTQLFTSVVCSQDCHLNQLKTPQITAGRALRAYVSDRNNRRASLRVNLTEAMTLPVGTELHILESPWFTSSAPRLTTHVGPSRGTTVTKIAVPVPSSFWLAVKEQNGKKVTLRTGRPIRLF